MNLYRPVGLKELRLIAQSQWRAFPPRLDWQPIFYPVLNVEYAEQIAATWNTRDAASEFCGFVTKWLIDDEYIKRYPVQVVGAKSHQELWIPAEDLAEFNAKIVGRIEVLRSHYGERFEGEIDAKAGLPVEIVSIGS
jgi:hypothetical protein